jgi:uncharacterized protein (DUF885 family)
MKRTVLATLLLLPTTGAAQETFYERPDLAELARGGMRDVIGRYQTDVRTHRRFFDMRRSPARREHLSALGTTWLEGLAALDFDALGTDDRIDLVLFENLLRYGMRQLELSAVEQAETAPLLPFVDEVAALHEARRRLEPVDAPAAAQRLTAMVEVIEEVQERLRAGLAEEEGDEGEGDEGEVEPLAVDRVVANRAAGEVRDVAETLENWFDYFDGYDPLFSWWVREPFEATHTALQDYATFLTEEVVGIEEGDTDTIIGDPIGRDALLAELEREWIPYTPEELVEIANAEFAWCDREMLRASHDLGFGDEWRSALEHVKGLHVAPGEQTRLVGEMAHEAVRFLEERELVTVPTFAKTSWRMEMMSPARQKFSPYFTGGEVISVAFPTDGMSHEEKRMSMRGNNIHFSRAVVHHELIPGHHLQQYMTARHKSHRRPFGTPFWGEGWALYWEMLLWDEEFPRSAEDRVGMLFWRMHRCARIIFSLGFQLGDMTPEECIDFLVERVGHERNNATAEVRRSVQGGYGPLYQAAYMLGGLQFRALHRELVGSGEMTNRAFHDAILREGSIPVELVRAKLTGRSLTRDMRSNWRFYEELR